MNFGKADIAILIAMSIAIMGMSFTMPALGMSSENASEPPQFKMNSSRFDFAGEFPNNPGGPGKGTLHWVEQLEGDSDNVHWLEGDSYNGVELAIYTTSTTNEPTVGLTKWESGSDVNHTKVTRTVEGYETVEISESGGSDWKVRVHFYDIETINASNGEYNFTVDYEVRERPSSGGGFVSGIPLVGGLFDTGAELAGIIGWIGAILWWGVTFVFQVAINLIFMLYDIMVFLVGAVSWLTGTYFGLMNAANGWATAVLALPSLLISLELAKLVMVAISLLPTT